jgi:hypothetical protein
MPRKITYKIWVSTYCNFAHNRETGVPIKHECSRLNPPAMELERLDRFDLIGESEGCVSMYWNNRKPTDKAVLASTQED